MSRIVLVGIVTRNRSALLPKAISSALAQRGCSVRVSVIDDCSSDDTSSIAQRFPMVEWARFSEPRGHMAARNEWMNSDSAEFFVSLDDDAWFVKGDEVSVALKAFDQNPQVAAVAYDILSPDKPQVRSRTGSKLAASYIGCGHMLRLAALRGIGGYAPAPGRYGSEEKDLCLRLMDAGHQVVLLPGVHVWHEKSPMARVFPEQFQSLVCNDLAFTFRRTPTALLAVAMLAKVLQHCSFAARRGLLGPCLQGFGQFTRSWQQVWRSRDPVKLATLRAFMKLARS